MSAIIKIENLSKQYRLGITGTGTLSHDLNRWWYLVRGKEDPYLKIGDVNLRSTKGTSEYIWALKDINFEVQQGEVLGIIGKNGAGKSTLLRILSKVTAPTSGRITYKGRIGSLLEVGTGFHLELTGRENAFLNGAILGMRKKEIENKFDEIVDFSGCERYIDTPVKRYSSGMMVRLGFAVAAFLESEILVVDEVLAVGDAEFQKKAIGKMQNISHGDGRTVLFVSHNMGAVKNLCKTGILLENGYISEKGDIANIIDKYLQNHSEKDQVYYPKNNIVTEVNGSQVKGKIILSLKYESDKSIVQPNFGFILYDNFDNPIFGTNPLNNGILDFGKPKNKGEVRAVITAPHLVAGSYPVSIWFSDGIAMGEHIFHKEKCIYLSVSDMNNSFVQKDPHLGLVIPSIEFRFS
jgi:lipopolysaccharide transport system ATP-binding protein